MAESKINSSRSVGVELGRSSMTAVCIGRDGTVFDKKDAEISFRESAVKQMSELLSEFTKACRPFEHLGIAVPGLVSSDGRTVKYCSHIPELSGMDLAAEVEAGTGIRAIIENDANAGGYGEFVAGAGRDAENLFYATLGSGVGGALIFKGALWRGAAGFAGEFGYFTIDSDGTRLEDVASTPNIIRRTRSRFHQDNTSSLVELDEAAITLDDIVAAAVADDDLARLMLERTGTFVGTAIASVIDLLNIEMIVIGGEVMEADHIVLNAAIERARELAYSPSFDSTEIIKGELGNNAAAIGAGLLAFSA